MERLENFKLQVGVLLLAQIIALIVLYIAEFTQIAIALAIFLTFNIALIVWIMYRYQNDKANRDIDISRILGTDAKDALLFGEVGIITYDEQHTATWVNDFMELRHIDICGKKVTSWIAEINELFQGDVDTIIGKDGDHIYEITRKENGQVLYVRDVTELYNMKDAYEREQIVIGLLHLDNYMEIQQYEDEAKMGLINTNLRQPLIHWATSYGMFIRRLRSDRYLVMMNEEIFAEVVKDRFVILNQIRQAADDIDVSITLSMAFARGTNDYAQMDMMVNDLLELAQSRGGDQVAVKRFGENVKYYGGNSEAQEKRSKVRVRVMAQAIKEAITDADRVFIVGHKIMDFDCMGAALCVDRICRAYGKQGFIVSRSGGIEKQLSNALDAYDDKLAERHEFIDDHEASRMLRENDLVIAVDHNSPGQCGAPLTLDRAEKIMVIDHHRRSETFMENPLLVYIESSASSVSELVTELLPYQTNKVDISLEEATLMYLGILVDTNRFKTRTGSRTFETAAQLKKLNVDPIEAENMLKESFEDFYIKTNILKYAKVYKGNMIISAVDDANVISRTLMSQSADAMLNIKGIEAGFVIAKTADDSVAISARSKGVINVQSLMERMQGGGHFTAAALQREHMSVHELREELVETIDEYLKEEEDQHEGNIDK